MTEISIDHLATSQFGEDRVLWRMFRQKLSGFFVEVGAYDGVKLSNTHLLECVGWHGILVEPIEDLARQAASARPRCHVVAAAASRRGSAGTSTFTVADNVEVLSFLQADEAHVERCRREGARLRQIQVPLVSLDAVLAQAVREMPPDMSPWSEATGWRVDVVSIDTEGCELDVLDGLDLDAVRPRVLVIENDRPSGAAIEPYLADRGYRRVHRQTINDFYIRNDTPSDELCLDHLAC